MADTPPPELIRQTTAALRYTLAVLGESDRQAAGGSPEDAAPVSMTVDEAIALAPHLAHLVIAARQAIAGQLGITGRAEQARFVRGQLESEIEILEINAAFAGVEAEVNGAAG